MLVVTTSSVPGYQIQGVVGEVRGTYCYSGRDTSLNMLANASVIDRALDEAILRMCRAVTEHGNAVIDHRIETLQLPGYVGVISSGTAVSIRPLEEGEPGATPQSVEEARRLVGGDWPQPPGSQSETWPQLLRTDGLPLQDQHRSYGDTDPAVVSVLRARPLRASQVSQAPPTTAEAVYLTWDGPGSATFSPSKPE